MDASQPTIRKIARWLRREFPVGGSVGRIRCFDFGENANALASTTIHGNIQIDSSTPPYVQRESLLHEWAHVRVGWKGDEPHTQAFWKELGRIVNAYHAWREDQE